MLIFSLLPRMATFLTIFILFSAQCHAIINVCSDAIAGYREDKITMQIDAFDPPGKLLLTDRLDATKIRICETGINGRASLFNSWFAQGYATVGTVCSGSYRDTVDRANSVQSLTKAHIQSGNTRAFSLGGAYLLSFFDCFRIGPAAGWSYDFQRIKMRHATTNRFPNPVLNNSAYKNRWQGLWVGAETQVSLWNIVLEAGYAYHWINWKASWLLDGPDIMQGSYSDHRKARRGQGEVYHFNGYYCLCEEWSLGLGVTYQYWEATKGKEVPIAGSFPAVGLSKAEVDKIPKVTWESLKVQASVGYYF